MKKNVLRIFATAAAVVALALVIVLLVTAFGGIDANDYDNGLARGLITAMSIAFMLLTATTLTLLFVSDETTKEIALRTGQEGNTRITVGVIKKIAKESAAKIPGVKCKKCVIVTNEYGVRLKLAVSIKEKDVEETENEIRALLCDAYFNILGFKFHSIEIRVKKLVPAYKADVEKIVAEADKRTAENKARAAEEETAKTEEATVSEPETEEIPDDTAPEEEPVTAEETAKTEEETALPEEEKPVAEEAEEEISDEPEETDIEAEQILEDTAVSVEGAPADAE